MHKAIKTVLKALRYQELSELLGKQYEFDDMSSVPEILIPILKSYVIGDLTLQDNLNDMSQICCTNRLMDLSFELEPQPSTSLISIRELKKFGFLPDKTEVEQLLSNNCSTDDQGFLFQLLEDLQKEKWWCRIFLIDARLKPLPDFNYERDKARFDSVRTQPPFPAAYLLQDACITNAENIWFFKHFWM